jgi:hypothetical protein
VQVKLLKRKKSGLPSLFHLKLVSLTNTFFCERVISFTSDTPFSRNSSSQFVNNDVNVFYYNKGLTAAEPVY